MTIALADSDTSSTYLRFTLSTCDGDPSSVGKHERPRRKSVLFFTAVTLFMIHLILDIILDFGTVRRQDNFAITAISRNPLQRQP